MNTRRLWARGACFIFAAVMALLFCPIAVRADDPKFDTAYLSNQNDYFCDISSGNEEDEGYEGSYAVRFVEFVYRKDPTVPLDQKRLMQSRTLVYVFDDPEEIAGQSERFFEIVKYDDGWSSSYIGWNYEFSMSINRECASEDELMQWFKEHYIREQYKETGEETTIGGRRALKVVSQERKPPTELHSSVTQIDEGVTYYVILPSQLPHAGYAFLRVNSSMHGAANYYTPIKSTAIAQLQTYYNDYVSRFDKVVGALCGAAFTVEQKDVWVETPVKTAQEEKKEKPKATVVVDSDAQETPGETGVSVPAAVVVGVLGAAAAAAGAGAAAGGAGQDEGESKKRSSYRMYLRKDFGDKIRYDKQPVTVYARMEEITETGAQVDRPDLTGRIQIFSGGDPIKVDGCAMAGNYMGALICAQSAPGRQKPEVGVVSFLFTGEGGTFQNNVTFKLVGEPYVRFPEQGKDLFATVQMLYGDAGDYACPVEFCDYTIPVEQVEIKVPDGRPVDARAEKVDETHYILHLQNRSEKPGEGRFQTESFDIEVSGENKDEFAKQGLRVILQPEGLSVRDMGRQFDEDGAMRVGCYPDRDAPETGEIVPTRFLLQLAVSETDAAGNTKARIVPAGEYTPAFAPMEGTDAQTGTLVSRYPCEVNPADEGRNGAWRIEPRQALPDPDSKHFRVVLPVSTEYAGVRYEARLPLRLIGEPLDPMAGWDEEYAVFQKRVRRYGLSEQLALRMRAIGRQRSTAELRLLNKMILVESMAYYTDEARTYNDIADRLQAIEGKLELLKWFGDQAFSILMTMYAGPVGEAVITPAKEIVVALIGEAGAEIISGQSFEFEKLNVSNNIAAAFENCILSMLGEPNISLKKVGTVVAGFAVFNLAKHYALDVDANGNRDFYKAVTSAFGDLTVTAVKAAAGNYFGKLASDQRVVQRLNGWTGSFLRKHLPDMAWQKPGSDILSGGLSDETAYILSKANILQKYVEEICGIGAAMVYSTLNEANEQGEATFDTNTYVLRVPIYPGADGPQSTIYATVDFMKVKDRLFEFIFSSLFGSVGLPKAPVQAPADPPYTKAGA